MSPKNRAYITLGFGVILIFIGVVLLKNKTGRTELAVVAPTPSRTLDPARTPKVLNTPKPKAITESTSESTPEPSTSIVQFLKKFQSNTYPEEWTKEYKVTLTNDQ